MPLIQEHIDERVAFFKSLSDLLEMAENKERPCYESAARELEAVRDALEKIIAKGKPLDLEDPRTKISIEVDKIRNKIQVDELGLLEGSLSQRLPAFKEN